MTDGLSPPVSLRPLDCANDVGPLGEEVAPATGELPGDLPRGFSHGALVDAPGRLERRVDRHGLR